jgi:hypothetical protein
VNMVRTPKSKFNPIDLLCSQPFLLYHWVHKSKTLKLQVMLQEVGVCPNLFLSFNN